MISAIYKKLNELEVDNTTNRVLEKLSIDKTSIENQLNEVIEAYAKKEINLDESSEKKVFKKLDNLENTLENLNSSLKYLNVQSKNLEDHIFYKELVLERTRSEVEKNKDKLTPEEKLELSNDIQKKQKNLRKLYKETQRYRGQFEDICHKGKSIQEYLNYKKTMVELAFNQTDLIKCLDERYEQIDNLLREFSNITSSEVKSINKTVCGLNQTYSKFITELNGSLPADIKINDPNIFEKIEYEPETIYKSEIFYKVKNKKK